jgi:exodeoxyribonuclease VII large subunit
MRKPFLQPQTASPQPQRQILTVSELNRKSKSLLESELGSIWLQGEISNFIKAASGHWYFTLKDRNAQIKSALFKFKNRSVNFAPKEGDQVVVKGKVSVYEARGDYQLIADYMELAGAGQLQQQLNALIEKLSNQGLFDEGNKQPLPYLPNRIGVITSPTGAAVHDVITVLQRRCPMVPVTIYPTQVQGSHASNHIIGSLKLAQQRNECDVLLVTRGGGSLEDLWCFNDESLAHAIADCSIPIVAAVGHEVDITITELAADLRAATPSAAAELLVPDQQALWQRVDGLSQQLNDNLLYKISALQNQLLLASAKLKDPKNAILTGSRQLDHFSRRLKTSYQQKLTQHQSQLDKLTKRITHSNPKEKLLRNQFTLSQLKDRLSSSMKIKVEQSHNQLAFAANKLDTLSPLSTLSRGYAIARDKESNQVISKVEQSKPNQLISLILSNGDITCRVTED